MSHELLLKVSYFIDAVQKSAFKRPVFGGLCISILGGLYGCTRPAEISPPDSSLVSQYDYYLANMELSRFDPDGELLQSLAADHYAHFLDDGHAELHTPRVVWHAQSGERWLLESRTGHLRPHNEDEEILLSGSVNLSNGQDVARPLSLQTESMTVHTVSQIAQTDSAVTLLGDGFVMSSNGMQLELSSGHLQLISNVRGRYEP